jgi:hypothetical protein
VEEHKDDQLCIDLAPLYVAYGSALLEQLSANAMGTSSGDVSSETKATGVDLSQSEVEDLAEDAWSWLETARVVYSNHLSGDSEAARSNKLAMASVLCQIGELQLMLSESCAGRGG